MREILFRGKRIDNSEWETGSLVYARMGTSEEQVGIADKMTAYHTPVIPETVGQYTGLTDKNGTRIFEGDILEEDLEDNLDPGAKWRSVVVWGKFGWNCKGGHVSLPIDEFDIKKGEVIGNIHDNPELMEESKMSKSSSQLPIIIGHKYRKGVFCIRSNMGGYDMYIVTLRSDHQTGEKFDMSEIEQIHTVLHFCDRSAVEQTIGALEWILKRGIEDDRKRSDQ